MTKKKLIRIILFVSIFYGIVFIAGIGFYLFDKSAGQKYYAEYKDILPVIISIPLGYIGSCFQRRSSFLTSLRLLWGNIIHAVNKAILFTEHRVQPEKEYLRTLLLLSKSIDEIRGVYTNINETKTEKGYYPFESLKTIYTIIEELGSGDKSPAEMKEANMKIREHWLIIRKTFLAEFDRSEPTVTDTINTNPNS